MAYETVLGYCWPQSVAPGERVGLHLSAPSERVVSVTVERIGLAAEELWTAEVAPGHHPIPEGADSRGCGWPVAVEIPVGEWRSGFHLVTLTVDVDGKTRTDHAFFVVRPARTSQNRILLALATNTWHAYNDVGGRNLYTGGVEVSLQRPMARGLLHKPPGPGRRVTNQTADDRQMTAHVGYLRLNRLTQWGGSAGWPDWEAPFLAWAERNGYGIDVVTNNDLTDHPEVLDGKSLFLSVGHDEYWSAGMRDTVEDHIASGGHAAFLSGNTSFWQVRMEGEASPLPTMVGYKGQFKRDPVFGTDRVAELTSMWSDHLIERSENSMTGVSFARGGYHRIGKRVTNGAGGYTIHRGDHWLFDGTAIDYGDVLGGEARIVGYECDGCDFTYRDGLPYPTGVDGTPTNFTILGTAPAAHFTRTTAGRPPAPHEPDENEFIASRLFGSRAPEDVARIAHGHAVLGTYTSAAGGTVVTSGSTDWAHGLDRRDPQVERITANLLDRLG